MQYRKKCVILLVKIGKAGITVTVLIVIFAVCAVIAALVSFVLLSSLSVRIVYKETLEVFAGLSFIKFKIFPRKKKEKVKKKKRKKKAKAANDSSAAREGAEQKENIPDSLKDAHKSKKKDIGETLKLVFEIIKSVFDVMGKRAVIKIDELCVVVSREDAADTAVYFGICGGVVSNILAFTSNFGKAVINDKNISVDPDFISGKSSLSTDITLSVPTGSLLIGLIKGYLKGISKK